MTLTPDEMKQYKQLQAKAEAVEKPLTDDDLRRMEQCVASALNVQVEFLQATTEAWKPYMNTVLALGKDNSRLIAEVRRLSANNQGNRTNPRSG